MTAQNSGTHLLVEISSELFSDLFRKFVLGTESALGLACEMWPSPSAVIQLRTNADGDASFGAIRADGSDYDNGLPLKELLKVALDFEVKARLHLQNLNLSDAALDRLVNNLTLQEKLDLLLEDLLPLRTAPSPATLGDHISLAEILTGSTDTIIGDFELRVVNGGTALAIAIFFIRSAFPHVDALAAQDPGLFANFNVDFLMGQRFAVSVSTELMDRFILQRAEVQAALRQALPPELYTPEDPNHFVTLTVDPPHRLKLSGRGEFQTEDCGGVDADWWVFVEPFIQDGFLKIRAQYDYDSDFEDGVQVFLCIVGNVLIGGIIGFLAAGFIGEVVGAILNFPTLMPGGMNMSPGAAVSCGDNCYEITITNPTAPDGRLVFPIDEGQFLSALDINVDGNGMNLFGDAVLTFRTSALQIRDIRPWIHATSESVCAGQGLEYQPASFLLFNPHQPYENEFDWPEICSITLTPDLAAIAEVVLVPQNEPVARPFRVHGVNQQRVEIRINAAPPAGAAISGAAIVRTNTPPTTRTVPVTFAATGEATIEVDPTLLVFEQRDEEYVDLRNLRDRNMCREPIPLAGNLRSVGASFTIRNIGPGVLHICDLVLNDPNQVFQLSGPRSFSLLAGSETHVALVLNMNAAVQQQYTATVSVISTDANNPQVDVTVRGTALTAPRGINVGGQIIVVDNFYNAACLDLALPDDGPIVEIPLDKWVDIFVDPIADPPDTIGIFELSVRHSLDDLDFVVREGRNPIVEANFGGATGRPLTLLEPQMKTGAFKGLQEGTKAHFHVSAYEISPEREFRTKAPVKALWASGSRILLSTDGQLIFLRLEKDSLEVTDVLKNVDLGRLAGKKRVHGISKRGLEVLSIDDRLDFGSGLKVSGALDLAVKDDRLVYLLTKDSLLTIDVSTAGEGRVLVEQRLDHRYEQVILIQSHLYLFGNETLAVYDVSRPWIPSFLSAIKLRNVEQISHLGTDITATGKNGTQVLALGNDGKPRPVIHYRDAHWTSSFIVDRHHRYLLSLMPGRRGFKLWRSQTRRVRPFGSGEPPAVPSV